MRKYIILLLIGAMNSINVSATEGNQEDVVTIVEKSTSHIISESDTTVSPQLIQEDIMKDKIIVGHDTVSIIIPEKNFGRYDRGLFNYLFIPKGQWSFGLTASYGEFDASDMQMLKILTDLDFKGSMFSLKPYISYFFRNNQAIGMRLGYIRNKADLSNISMDFGDDLNFKISDVLYHTESYSASIFYRHYLGLGRDKRFAIFNEVDLAFASGNGSFRRKYNNEPRDTRTITTEGRLSFSPGLCVFIQDYVSFNISFGVFGLYFKKESQTTNNVDEGSRISSGADFKFNIFNINFGIAVHI